MSRLTSFIYYTCICIANVAQAQFILYGDDTRDEWFADAAGTKVVTTLSFTEFPLNTTITDQYSEFGITFEGLNFVTGPFPGTFPNDSWGLRIFNGNDLYFDEPINAIAADFIGALRLDIYYGDTFLFRFQNPHPHVFTGGISEIPFDHVKVYDPFDFLTVIDDLHFGPPIPAPASIVSLVLPWLFTRRRRR